MLENERRIEDLSMDERRKLAEKALGAIGSEHRKSKKRKGKTMRRSQKH
jgi:hypothetical protein